MRVFCSQCGTPNEGAPGTKVICTNCTQVFEVPAQDPGLAQTVMSPPAAPTQPASPLTPGTVPPAAQQPPATWSAPAVNPGQPGPLYPAPVAAANPPTDGLAIASLVLGILCCFPFNVAAIICGVLALQKINANPAAIGGKGLAIAGIALGGISASMTVLGFLAAMLGNH